MIRRIVESVNNLKWVFARYNQLVEGEHYKVLESGDGQYDLIISSYCFDFFDKYRSGDSSMEDDIEAAGFKVNDGLNKYHYIVSR